MGEKGRKRRAAKKAQQAKTAADYAEAQKVLDQVKRTEVSRAIRDMAMRRGKKHETTTRRGKTQ